MTNILNYILGGFLVVALLFAGGLWIENNSLEKKVLVSDKAITVLSVQRDALQKSNEDLKKAVDTQNTSLAKLEEIQASVTAMFTGFNSNDAGNSPVPCSTPRRRPA